MKKVFIFLSCLISYASCMDFQARELIKRELSGPLVKLEKDTHGISVIYVRDNKTEDTVDYALSITKFIEENNILVGDSISKEAGSHTIWFYKKKDGQFQKSAELYYY